MLRDEARVDEAAQVGGCRRDRYLGLSCVRHPVEAALEGSLEGADQAVRPSTLLDEPLEGGPANSGAFDQTDAPSGLLEMRVTQKSIHDLASRSGWYLPPWTA